MSKDNLTLWDQVKKTDPAYTKRVQQRGGYTAIAPQYQAQQATKQFGPYGQGWGLSQSSFKTDLLEVTGMIVHEAVFFYSLNGERVEFPIHNAIKPGNTTKDGTFMPDVDWAKKVETNTISKALSRLGFSADVFMGEFDDDAYVAQANTEAAIAKAEKRDDEVSAQQEKLTEYVKTQLELINKASHKSELAGIQKTALRHLNHQRNIPELTSIADRGITAIARDVEAKNKQLQEAA